MTEVASCAFSLVSCDSIKDVSSFPNLHLVFQIFCLFGQLQQYVL
jgi:hypothetical protein